MRVKNLKIRKIFASNSKPTIEIELTTEKGVVKASVPFGTSRGKHEVKFLPVEKAIKKFHVIKSLFISQDFSDQKDVDETLHIIDKTPDFREIGGNLALAISAAFLKAFALENDKEVFEFLGGKTISKPICNVAGGWKGQSDIQEFLLLPVHQESFLDSISNISSAYLKVGEILKREDPTFRFGKNWESAWLTSLHFRKILEILKKVATERNLKIGLDVAASQLWDGKYYVYSTGEKLTKTQQIWLMSELLREYPIIFLEDPFDEDDFTSFATLNAQIKEGRILCGDDLYTTNLKRLKIGLDFHATNAVLVKPNQIGTITDTINFVKEAKKHRLVTVLSHRSGETDDTLMCHLAVGLDCDYIKLGISGERIVKINEMIRIEEKVKKSI